MTANTTYHRLFPFAALLLFICCVLLLNSCTTKENEFSDDSGNYFSTVWYRQARVDIGAKIRLESLNTGFAVTNGRGDIPGQALFFNNGTWEEFHSFPYSDYPLIERYDSQTVWVVNHLTHSGAYKPVLNAFTNGLRKEIPLPRIMWDEVDYAMFKTLDVMPDGTAWMAGQQGNIIFYDGSKWIGAESPVNKKELPNLLAGDINDMFFLSPDNAWGVGKDGLIIRYDGRNWKKFPSPAIKHLSSIWMLNDNHGYICGAAGTLLRYNGEEWLPENIETAVNFTSIKGVDSNLVLMTGENSSFYFKKNYNDKWKRDEYIRSLGDKLLDVDVVIDSAGIPNVWIIGQTGIYTNSKTIGFSFTEFTSEASLRETGRAGFFFEQKGADLPNLFVINEQAPSLIYKNTGNNRFSEMGFSDEILQMSDDVMCAAAGDINNDGVNDLVLLSSSASEFKLLLGSGGGYIDFTEQSGIDLSGFPPQFNININLADFDNDGNLDLFIFGSEGYYLLFKGEGTGKFTRLNDLPAFSFAGQSVSNGVTLSDLTGNGLPDMIIPHQTAINDYNLHVYLNKGSFRFESSNDTSFTGLSSISILSTVALAADFNNDGHPDILIHNQKLHPQLYLNNGNGTFRDATADAGFMEIIFHPEPLNGTMNAADVNNDGYIDLYISSKLLLNGPGMKFREVSEQTGINFTGTPSFEDYDGDGDMDIYIGSSMGALGKGQRSAFFKNNLNNNNFVKVIPKGDKSNRSAYGTKVYVFSYDSRNKLISTQLRETALGHSPMVQQNINELHFGMVDAAKHNVVVKFPSGVKRVYENVKPGTTLTVRESNFINYFIIHSVKSLERTSVLIDPTTEIIKAIIFLMIIGGLISFGIKSGAKVYVTHIAFAAGLILLYVLVVHLTVMNNLIIKILLPFAGIPLIAIISISIARSTIRKIETEYISHYKLITLLGQGGMGKVYLAADVNDKTEVAVKILHPELLKDPENKKRFTMEGSLLSSFDHPNIVKVFETGEADGNGFIVMEYLPNGTLSDYLQKNLPLSFDELIRIALQICSGLSEIHSKNIIHRDIKTNNLMLDEHNNIRIMDFGLSKSNLVTTMTSLGTVLGTLGYVAPEQITNSYNDPRTDIFSLGVVLYELSTGKLPFSGENEIALIHSIFNTIPPFPSEYNSSLSSGFDHIVMKCLEKDMNNRYASVSNVALRLKKLL